MRKPFDPVIRTDILKLACFVLAVGGVSALFLLTPSLTLPTLCSVVLTAVLSPLVTAIERKGLDRTSAVGVIFGIVSLVLLIGSLAATHAWENEWLSFKDKAPSYYTDLLNQVTVYENKLSATYPFVKNLHLTEAVAAKISSAEAWFADNASGWVSSFFGCLFLVPILTFCFLSQGRTLRKQFFQLVPNRFFESVYIVTHGVSTSLSDYLRAKLIEAFLVGILTTMGLAAIQSPYAIVLGVWSGITNILPYVGPVLGALPGVLMALFDSRGGSGSVWPILIVFGIVNAIDTAVIFPGIVAKLVKLNPLVLIASVLLGQYYYGMVGMLISIPIAAALKVLLDEFYIILYGYSHDASD